MITEEEVELEKTYTVQELAKLWKVHPDTVRREFANERNVIKIKHGSGKRKYVTLRIPESVLARVTRRLSS